MADHCHEGSFLFQAPELTRPSGVASDQKSTIAWHKELEKEMKPGYIGANAAF